MMNKILLTALIYSIPSLSYAAGWTIIDTDELWQLSEKTGGAILDGLATVAGSIFVFLIIISGLRIMGSGGDQEDKKHAKSLMIFSVTALIILLAVDVIYKLFFDAFAPFR
ncbi:MAG: hypothetical protein PHW52_03840 [Candidatus Pacebacteria bacterium]|nr:hypothetical protein [Candidatus Paceibacterota bacterium]